MKKQLIIAALFLALAVLAFMLLYTVTVYPAFQKSVGSIDTLRQALRSDAILYPAVERIFGRSRTIHFLWMDERFLPNRSAT